MVGFNNVLTYVSAIFCILIVFFFFYCGHDMLFHSFSCINVQGNVFCPYSRNVGMRVPNPNEPKTVYPEEWRWYQGIIM